MSIRRCLQQNLTVARQFSLIHQVNMSSLTAKKHYDRLPKSVIPVLYKLQLKPDLEKFTFSGKEDIEVSVKEGTNQVVLNVAEIEIKEALFKHESGGLLQGQVNVIEKDEKAFIKFEDELKTGNGILSLTFSGILNDRMKGFYRSKYTTLNGEERYAAVTQFEAPDARRAFPCWDEPAFKAKFEVTIIAPKDRTVLSNTDPVKETVDPEDSNLKVIQFAPTPIMSTYLLAFIVGEYDYLETFTDRGTRMRVYTPLGKKEQGTFALEVATKSLEFFEKYFDIPFPLSKLDHIGIPDFASGAMENWGLVTYREARVLSDPHNTSAINREFAAITIAHETAHQWFGDLVTMEWWTDLWLNEGFASFMEYLSVDKIFPQFSVWSRFVSSDSLDALRSDSFHNSHPIEVPVSHPNEIDSIFDNISYQKGSCIIRMCHDLIGDEAFRKGLHNYLSKHAYGNAVTQDLWDSLEAASGKPVSKTMPYWTKQMGYPIIRVESKQDGNNRILKLEQKKFSFDGILTDEEKSVSWAIPVSVITSQNPEKVALSTLMSTKSTEVVVPNVDGWIKLNAKAMGFYRVSYSTEMLDALRPAISSKQLGPIDRLQIIDDLSALAISGEISTKILLDFLEAYVDEDSYVTWATIDNCFDKLEKLLEYTDLLDNFHRFCIQFYSKIFEKIGFDPKDGDSHNDILLRSLVLSRMASCKHPPIIEESIRRFKDHCSGKLVHPDLRNVVYKAVSSTCDDENFSTFFKLYRQADSSEEKSRLLNSLGHTSNRERVHKVLQFALSEEVRIQDAWRPFLICGLSRLGREEAWKAFKDNAAEFRRRYGAHSANSLLLEYLLSNFASLEMGEEIEKFFIQNPFSGQENVILRALEEVRTNASWLKREADSLKDFFAKYSS